MKSEYLSVKRIAEITGLDCRNLAMRCKRGKYITREVPSIGGRGGVKYEILVSSLEPELQEKLRISSDTNADGGVTDAARPISLVEYRESKFNPKNNPFFQSTAGVPAVAEVPAVPVSLGNPDDTAVENFVTNNAKRIALAKYDTVAMWREFRAKYTNKKTADADFVTAFNKGFISETLAGLLGKLSRGTLYRWFGLLKGNDDYRSLINNYNYTGESRLDTTLTDLEIGEFIKIYFNDAQMNLETCYNLMRDKFTSLGIPIHSVSTFRRWVKHINGNYKWFSALARQGEKAYNDNVGVYLQRDITDLKAGDVLIADGNKLDFFVKNPFTGKPCRATMVVYIDWISFDVAGFEIMLSENTQCISSALRNSILRLGRFPKMVYMDNGKAFRGTYFTGCESLTSCGFKGIYKNLGIDLTIARAYSGRSKVVERFFRNFVKSAPPMMSSYIGNCIENRPARYKRNEQLHKELHKDDKIPTIEEAKQMIESWLEYYRRQPCPHDKTKTVGEMFLSGCGDGVDPDMLDELLMASDIRTVKRNIIRIFGLEYTSVKLHGLDRQVVIKYSLFDIRKIKVYSLKGEYICEAEPVVKVKALVKYGSAVDMYNFKKQIKIQKSLRKQAIAQTKAILKAAANPFADYSWSAPILPNNSKSEEKPDDERPKSLPKKKRNLEITCYEHIERKEKPKYDI